MIRFLCSLIIIIIMGLRSVSTSKDVIGDPFKEPMMIVFTD